MKRTYSPAEEVTEKVHAAQNGGIARVEKKTRITLKRNA
jgi:hypothetical protein